MVIERSDSFRQAARVFYYDAHNHLHDARLDSIRDEAISRLTSCGLNGAIVNGTREQGDGRKVCHPAR